MCLWHGQYTVNVGHHEIARFDGDMPDLDRLLICRDLPAAQRAAAVEEAHEHGEALLQNVVAVAAAAVDDGAAAARLAGRARHNAAPVGAAVRHVRLPYGNIVGLDALQHGEADVVVVAVDVGHFFTAAGERRAGNDHIGLQWAKIFRQKPVAHAKFIHCIGHDAGVQFFEAGHQFLYRRHFHVCHDVKNLPVF